MRALALLLCLVLLQPAAPVNMTARWDSATSATVQWTQARRGCLYRQPAAGAGVFLGCYERTGTITLTFGHAGPLDAAYRPRAGDTYVLTMDGQTYAAPLIGRPVYLPVIR